MKVEEAQEKFDELTYEEKKMVLKTLNKIKHSYLVSGAEVDVPYFFWSINPILFKGVDPSDFLKIEDAYEFGVQAVYYISRFLINKRR